MGGEGRVLGSNNTKPSHADYLIHVLNTWKIRSLENKYKLIRLVFFSWSGEKVNFLVHCNVLKGNNTDPVHCVMVNLKQILLKLRTGRFFINIERFFFFSFIFLLQRCHQLWHAVTTYTFTGKGYIVNTCVL